jgi:hypothetical protein
MTWRKTMTTLVSMASIGVLMTVPVAKMNVTAAAANTACELLAASELEATLGAKVTMMPFGGGGLCRGQTPTGSVMLTLRETKPGAESDLAKAVAQAKQRGIQMDVKKFGPITCTTMSPMKDVKAPFLTSCSVDKGTRLAAVEVTAMSQKDTVTIEKLRTLAEKMASRF